jgi:soluble lytic murein transglycosylase-like protein
VAASPPVLPAVSARVACLEAKESGGANVANRRGSGAVGVLQFMPSTFAAHAAEMGHPEYSPWNPAQARAVAAHDLALGRRAQWTVGGC